MKTAVTAGEIASEVLGRGTLASPDRPPPTLATLRGRLVELDGGIARGAALTLAVSYLREAQDEGEPVAWVSASASSSIFFPPDLVAWGIDLTALPVVRASGHRKAFAAVDKLLRSGAFGLVVVDFESPGDLPLPVQTRLSGLVSKHEAVVLFLTERAPEEDSLGSLLSLRLRCQWRRRGGRFVCRTEALKDKRQGPGGSWELEVDGAPGLR